MGRSLVYISSPDVTGEGAAAARSGQKKEPRGSLVRYDVVRGGIEPSTRGFSVLCSTD